MPFYEKGKVRIHYEEAGSGFPLFIIPGGGLNANIGKFDESHALAVHWRRYLGRERAARAPCLSRLFNIRRT